MPEKKVNLRLAALTRFAVAITVFNILGHVWLGFEQAWAHPLVALVTAYGVELLLELVEARLGGRTPRFAGSLRDLVVFLLPAHITGLAVAMLLYANTALGPVVFATAVAIASKYLFRVTINGRRRHFFNPSNLGITVTLLLFPWVGIAMPYQFMENLGPWGDWILPAVMISSGTLLNARFTRKMPLIVAWVSMFVVQAVVRSVVFGTPMLAPLLPMTGVAFILFTFYMVTDPSTTPQSKEGQVIFGAAVALIYGLLLVDHVVFTLFFALSIVSLFRGVGIWLGTRLQETALAPAVLGKRDPIPDLLRTGSRILFGHRESASPPAE